MRVGIYAHSCVRGGVGTGRGMLPGTPDGWLDGSRETRDQRIIKMRIEVDIPWIMRRAMCNRLLLRWLRWRWSVRRDYYSAGIRQNTRCSGVCAGIRRDCGRL